VILLSWDGVRPDYLDRGSLPALERLLREGARADRLLPAFPPITFPSHVTLATGTHADRHGIVSNRIWDPQRGEFDYGSDASWIEAEPLWIAAERQGVRAAVFFWVGSETDWRGARATYRVSPFDNSVPESLKVDRILGWLDLPSDERPRLLMAYWRGADSAGHRYGPNSSQVDAAMRDQDAALGQLLAGLDARGAWPTTTLLIVSDHGMVEAGDQLDAAALLEDRGIHARVVQSSAVAQIHLRDMADRERAVRALDEVSNVRAFARDALPAALRYNHPRVGDVVAFADPPRVFRSGGGTSLALRIARAVGWTNGYHGFNVETVPEMAGILIGMGRGVASGRRLGAARSIDVAPTVAGLLGIDPPAQSEGARLSLGKPDANVTP
jgi:predicted AlkP superfamily pyrophosphatase or phosphodiesterase